MIFDNIRWRDGIWIVNSESEFIAKDEGIRLSNHIFMIVVWEGGKLEHLLNIDIGGDNDIDFIEHQIKKTKSKFPRLPAIDATALHYDKEKSKYLYGEPMFQKIADKIYLFYPAKSEFPLVAGKTYEYFIDYTGFSDDDYFADANK